MNIIDIARANGVIGDRHSLAALESRIRADEREKFITAAEKYVFAVDNSPEAVRTKDGILLAVLATSDAAPVAEPESINSHLTDGDRSQVQARSDVEQAAWLADKISALGDYAKEAAAMLRRWPVVEDAPL